MKRSALRYIVLALAPFIFAACDQVSSPAPQTPSAELSADAQRTNASLDKMARLFAQAVTDGTLRQQIRTEAAKRFDGDTNVLYKTLAASSGVRGALATAYSRDLNIQSGDALSRIDELAKSIPRFQVAVPVNLNTWDAANYTPLVGFMPTGVDDTTLKTITAYDASGKAYQLDARVAPKWPVIVLGLSERTDDAGNVRQDFLIQDELDHALSAQGTYQVRVVNLTLYDENEPWTSGDPEVMLIAKGSGLYYHAGFTQANHANALYVFDRVIGTTTGSVIFYWYEDDSGSLDFTVTYKGVSLNTKIANGDDFMGAIQIGNSYFEGGSNNGWNLGELYMTTD